MRHGDKINNLSRTASHRKALLSNMAIELITHKRIVTTLAKARALRTYIEPLVTKGKENTTHQRRIVFSYLQDKVAVAEFFGNIAEKVGGRPGGYTRMIKLGARRGDNAETALIELVDFNEIYGKGKAELLKKQSLRLTLLHLLLRLKKRLKQKNNYSEIFISGSKTQKVLLFCFIYIKQCFSHFWYSQLNL
jgi:large subunit ribosomal protein L17